MQNHSADSYRVSRSLLFWILNKNFSVLYTMGVFHNHFHEYCMLLNLTLVYSLVKFKVLSLNLTLNLTLVYNLVKFKFLSLELLFF